MDIVQIDKSEGEDEGVMQCNSAVHMIDPIRHTSNSQTTSENPTTVGLPTRHHQRVRRSVSSATGGLSGRG